MYISMYCIDNIHRVLLVHIAILTNCISYRCDISGDPKPDYEWRKNDKSIEDLPISTLDRLEDSPTNWGSRLTYLNDSSMFI